MHILVMIQIEKIKNFWNLYIFDKIRNLHFYFITLVIFIIHNNILAINKIKFKFSKKNSEGRYYLISHFLFKKNEKISIFLQKR